MRPEVHRACIVGLVISSFLIVSCERRGSDNRTVGKAEAFSFKAKPTSTITFLSTQLNPVEEAGKMRNVILKDFPGKVEFRPNDSGAIFSQIEALRKANSLDAILIGASHGDFVSLYEKGALKPLNNTITRLEKRHFPETLVGLGRFNGKDAYYVPWMQASYIFVANKKALPYLPKGAKLDSLTYEQLYEWTGNIFRKTGTKALGFPAGKNGLMHRFFQGYLYPSYTASTLLKFRGAEARGMWDSFKSLWEYVNPNSLSYSVMAEPLLTGDVWIAWDHTARLIKAFKERPDDFVAFPAPIGPKGRGYMLIVAGLAIPTGTRDAGDQDMLIEYLTEPAIQKRTLDETGFFPAVRAGDPPGLPHYLESVAAAVALQTGSGGSVPTLAPIGLGERGTSYNNLFMLSFSRIVLEGEDIEAVLDANAAELQKLIDGANARCWLPDVSEKRPCKLE
jgi:multiple sugar transport system substrate-binding protein